MKRFLHIAVVVSGFILMPVAVRAGGRDGPVRTIGFAPAGTSVFYDIPFVADEPALVMVRGSGTSIMHVIVHDADGHVAVGNGRLDRKLARMDVYRGGILRVEVRNLGIRDNAFVLMTN